MKQNERNRSADTVFALILLTLFAVLALLLVIIGGNAYRATVERTERNNQLRTSVSYIANKVRAAGKDAELKNVDGVHTLVLREQSETGTYVTYIYEYNGSHPVLFSFGRYFAGAVCAGALEKRAQRTEKYGADPCTISCRTVGRMGSRNGAGFFRAAVGQQSPCRSKGMQHILRQPMESVGGFRRSI